ncbi:tyrosine-type recombinase/integrase [Sphingobium rhizovicinum]|uniref:Tyrosine-type recombinase/integrase n=1 Tax=Sphingobium rhizovicinum TaxID=432308 RepID=A0ABV7NIF3_9SPHN
MSEGGSVLPTVEPRSERIVSPIVLDIAPLAPAALTLAEVSERYLNDPTSARTAKSETIYRTTYATIIGIVGADAPAASINRETCREILDVLRRLPPNAKKRWPEMSPREVADMATAQSIAPMSVANVNEYMNKLSTLFNWAVKEEMLTRNPARGLKIADGTTAREKRRPFSVQQLQRIFDAPIYRGCVDDERGFTMIGKERPKRSRFWIPLIGLFAGMRLNEICQLHTADVRKLDGIWCFIVTGQGEGKRLKTASSERIVPVHPALINMAFLKYVEDRRRSGDVRLFPELCVDAFGLHSGRFSRWFARFLVTCDAAADRTCFHSFRHSFRDAMREAKVDREVVLALGGWASSGFAGGAVADQYGQGFSYALLADAVAQISYPNLNLTHLYTNELMDLSRT